MNNKILAPSLLAINKLSVDNELDQLKKTGIESIHYDVMDINYVNNSSFNFEYLDLLIEKQFKVDIHIMAFNPLSWIKKYVKYNINSICFQLESISKEEILESLDFIKKNKIKSGIAINPKTNKKDYIEYLKYCDTVIIMSVEPGKCGQKFMESSIENLSIVYDYQQKYNKNLIIQIDGGINLETILLVKKYANIFISGSSFFNANEIDRIKFISILKE